MANTYTSLHYHIVFSTNNRQRWIAEDIEERVWKYLGGIARENDMVPLKVGGIEDHIHVVVGMPPTMAPSKAAQLLKGGSSKWLHDTFPALAGFSWQDGYGAFTVSKSQLPAVIHYAGNQREHHRARTFQEEYRAVLDKHGIEYDERYLGEEFTRSDGKYEHATNALASRRTDRGGDTLVRISLKRGRG